MASNIETPVPQGGAKTRRKLQLLEAVSALAVLLLIVEFAFYSEERFGMIALWLLIMVVLVAQLLKLRLNCPGCGHSVYRNWKYSYRSKVPSSCRNCNAPLP